MLDSVGRLLCAATIVIYAASAHADPTVPGKGGNEAAAPEVDLGTSIVNRVSSAYETGNFTCTTTPTTLIAKRISVSARTDVTVHYQSENFPGCRILLSLLRDGVTVPGPGDFASPMAIHDAAGELSTNGFNFIDNNVPPGLHTYEVQCQCLSDTNLVDERSLIIYHR